MIGIETPDGIQTRDDLIYALSLAAELEHGICLQYLYAAYTLKTTVDGLTAAQAATVNQWETDLLLDRPAGDGAPGIGEQPAHRNVN